MKASLDLPKPPGAGTLLGHYITILLGGGLMLLGLPAGRGVLEGLAAWYIAWSGQAGLPAVFTWDVVWTSAVISTICVGLGAFLLFWGVSLVTRENAQTRNHRQHPDAPWKWRMEWGGRVIRARARSPMPGYLLTAWLAAVTLPAGVATSLAPAHAGEASWLGMTVLLTALAVSAFFTWRRHRDAVTAHRRGFALYPSSWPLGRGAMVRLDLRGDMAGGERVDVETRLLCEEVVERMVSSRGSRSESKSVRRNVLWEVNGRHPKLSAGQTLSWPVRLPAKLPESTANPDAPTRYEWRLEVRWAGLHTPLVFDVPVFGLAGSGQLAADAEDQDALAGVQPFGRVVMMDVGTGFDEDVFEAAPVTDLSTTELAEGLAARGIHTEWDGDRLCLVRLPARRHRRMLWLLGSVNTAWTALVAIMVIGGAPWFFSLGFGLFNALFWGLFLKVLTSDQVIGFAADGVRIARGRGADLQMATPFWLTSISVELSMRMGDRHYYNITGGRSDGTSGTLIGNVEGVHLCHALADRLLAVGRRTRKPRKKPQK